MYHVCMTKLVFVLFGQFPTLTNYYWLWESRCLFSTIRYHRKDRVVKVFRLQHEMSHLTIYVYNTAPTLQMYVRVLYPPPHPQLWKPAQPPVELSQLTMSGPLKLWADYSRWDGRNKAGEKLGGFYGAQSDEVNPYNPWGLILSKVEAHLLRGPYEGASAYWIQSLI